MANTQMLQQQADLYNAQMGKYGQEASKFNMAADVYNRQVKEYQALVDSYKALPGYQAYEKAVADYNAAVPAYNAAVPEYNRQLQKAWVERERLASHMNGWMNDFDFHQTVTELNRANARYAALEASILAAKPTEPVNAVADKAPGEFTAAKPEFTAKAPKDPGFTGQQMRQLQGQQTLAQQEKAGENETGLIQRVQGQKQRPDSIIGGMLQNVRYST